MTNIYTTIPFYVYKVECILTGEYYFGARYQHVNLGLSPEEDLWHHYRTSSREVKSRIREHGLKSFRYTVLYTHYDKDNVFWYEQDLIKDHIQDSLCLNKHYKDRNTDQKIFLTVGVTQWINTLTGQVVKSSECQGMAGSKVTAQAEQSSGLMTMV